MLVRDSLNSALLVQLDKYSFHYRASTSFECVSGITPAPVRVWKLNSLLVSTANYVDFDRKVHDS